MLPFAACEEPLPKADHLKKLRRERGLTQHQLCRSAGVNLLACCALERGARFPMKTDGSWTLAALRFADYFGVYPEDLFPEAREWAELWGGVTKLDVAEICGLLGGQTTTRELLPPDDACLLRERGVAIRAVLTTLRPREEAIMRRLYGIDVAAQDVQEIAAAYGITPPRIRKIKEKAERTLRKATQVFLRKDTPQSPKPRTWVFPPAPEGTSFFALRLRPLDAERWQYFSDRPVHGIKVLSPSAYPWKAKRFSSHDTAWVWVQAHFVFLQERYYGWVGSIARITFGSDGKIYQETIR